MANVGGRGTRVVESGNQEIGGASPAARLGTNKENAIHFDDLRK